MAPPMTREGEVDWPLTETLMGSIISHRTDALVVTGTAGEKPLPINKKRKLVTFGKQVAWGMEKIISPGGSN